LPRKRFRRRSRWSMRRMDPFAFTWTRRPEGLARWIGRAAGDERGVGIRSPLLGVGVRRCAWPVAVRKNYGGEIPVEDDCAVLIRRGLSPFV
jgi:hypothetical protein